MKKKEVLAYTNIRDMLFDQNSPVYREAGFPRVDKHRGLFTKYVSHIWGGLDPSSLSVIVSNWPTPSPLFVSDVSIWLPPPLSLVLGFFLTKVLNLSILKSKALLRIHSGSNRG